MSKEKYPFVTYKRKEFAEGMCKSNENDLLVYADCVWSKDCLCDLAIFIEELMSERKENLKNRLEGEKK